MLSALRSKGCISDGCISAYGTGNLHIWKGTINAERYMQAFEQHVLPFRRPLYTRGRPATPNHILYLLQQHGFVVEEWKMTQDCYAARILCQAGRGQHFWCAQFSGVYRLLLKVLQREKRGPVPTFVRCVSAIRFKMS